MFAALVAYFVFALTLAWVWRQGYIDFEIPRLRFIWLMGLAVTPNLLWYFFDLPVLLKFITAQVFVLTFLAINYNISGFKLLIVGLVSNAIPTLAHGGLMPVSADLMPHLYTGEWQVYDHIGWSVVLPPNEINFYWLSDWILINAVGKAYSPGDVLAFAGAVWVLVGCIKYKN